MSNDSIFREVSDPQPNPTQRGEMPRLYDAAYGSADNNATKSNFFPSANRPSTAESFLPCLSLDDRSAWLINSDGVYATRNDLGQIQNIQRGDGSVVEGITYDMEGNAVKATITKDGELVKQFQVGPDLFALYVHENGDVKAVGVHGTDTYKLDGSVVHSDSLDFEDPANCSSKYAG